MATVRPWAAEAVAEYLAKVRPCYQPGASSALWLAERGGRISVRHMNDRFAVYRDRLGLLAVLSPHCLRHSYVSHLVEDGVDPLFVQQQVGHSHAGHDRHLHVGHHGLPQPGAANGAGPGLQGRRRGRTMTRRMTYPWRLRQLTAAQGMFATTPRPTWGRCWPIEASAASRLPPGGGHA